MKICGLHSMQLARPMSALVLRTVSIVIVVELLPTKAPMHANMAVQPAARHLRHAAGVVPTCGAPALLAHGTPKGQGS